MVHEILHCRMNFVSCWYLHVTSSDAFLVHQSQTRSIRQRHSGKHLDLDLSVLHIGTAFIHNYHKAGLLGETD